MSSDKRNVKLQQFFLCRMHHWDYYINCYSVTVFPARAVNICSIISEEQVGRKRSRAGFLTVASVTKRSCKQSLLEMSLSVLRGV